MKKFISLSILITGLVVIIYGLTSAPLTNEAEIIDYYHCNRITADVRATDIYCSKPRTAPIAETAKDGFIYGGLIITTIGVVLTAESFKPRKKSNI